MKSLDSLQNKNGGLILENTEITGTNHEYGANEIQGEIFTWLIRSTMRPVFQFLKDLRQ